MCGLVGYCTFGKGGRGIDRARLEIMRDTMAHRGPDGAGLWISADGRVGLGHRRLSIIDLSERAAQPMPNEDGSLQVVFNGEIYNHADLRRELEATGRHRWRTDHSDTEVILHAFEEWGPDCVLRFRGMFAFALWDGRREGVLWLFRDRAGVKPLYYAVRQEKVVFASEIKALLADPDQPRAVDEETLFHYLTFLASPAPRTFFAGIHKVPAGHRLSFGANGEQRLEQYWDPFHAARDMGGDETRHAADVLDILRASVRLRKASDVPVGVFLSGGIDSSTNAALFSEGESRPVRAFTINYEGGGPSYCNESHFARLMARRVGAEHFERSLTQQDLAEFFPRMILLQDEPIADVVCFPMYFVSEMARQHGVIVCQQGEGADELFCGYGHWRRMWRYQRWGDWPAPRLLKRWAHGALCAAGKAESLRSEWLRRNAHGQPIFWTGCEYFAHATKMALLSPRLRTVFRGRTSWEAVEPLWRRFQERSWEKSRLHWMTYVDLNLRLPELLLMRSDKMSMGAGIEVREPFLDHVLIERVLSIPESVQMRNGALKYLLKKTVKGLIPDELIARPKQGFSIPLREWLASAIGPGLRAELDAFCRRSDYFDPAKVREMAAQPDGLAAWMLYNFALWHEAYIERK